MLYDEIVLEKVHEKIATMCDKNPDKVILQLTTVSCSLLLDGFRLFDETFISTMESRL